MFTRNDAQSLRETLSPFSVSSASPHQELIQSYLSQYQFQDTLPHHEYFIGTVNSGRYELVCQYFALPPEQQKACVFLVHGYYDHLGLYRHLIAHCLRQGYGVLGFDLPGHGLSSGEEASIDSFGDYVGALIACLENAKNQIQKPWVTVGQSTGGAIIMDFLLSKKPSPFSDHLLLCPLLYTKGWRWSRLTFYLLRWFVPSIKRTFAENSHDKDFLFFLRHNDSLQSRKLPVPWVSAMIDYHRRFEEAGQNKTPLHIIQGTGDTTVDWQRNMPLIAEKFPQSSLLKIDHARHHLVNESEEYREQVFERISRILAQT